MIKDVIWRGHFHAANSSLWTSWNSWICWFKVGSVNAFWCNFYPGALSWVLKRKLNSVYISYRRSICASHHIISSSRPQENLEFLFFWGLDGEYIQDLIVLPCLCELPNILLWNLQSSWIASVRLLNWRCGHMHSRDPISPAHTLTWYHDELSLCTFYVLLLNFTDFIWD